MNSDGLVLLIRVAFQRETERSPERAPNSSFRRPSAAKFVEESCALRNVSVNLWNLHAGDFETICLGFEVELQLLGD
jgi:hypothetical protein